MTMPQRHCIIALCFTLSFLIACGTTIEEGISEPDPEQLIYHPIRDQKLYSNEIAVYAIDSASESDIQDLAHQLNSAITGKLSDVKLYQLRFENPSNDYSKIDDILSRAKASPYVHHAFYNSVYQSAKAPPDWANISGTTEINWGQKAINMEDAWAQIYNPAMSGVIAGTSNGAGISHVAILDQLFNINNDDLRNVSVIENYGGGVGDAECECTSTPEKGCKNFNKDHGNAVAALIGANNAGGTPVSGVNWTVRMHLYPFHGRNKTKNNLWCTIDTSSTGGSHVAKFIAMEAFLKASELSSTETPVVINYSAGQDWTCTGDCPMTKQLFAPDPAWLVSNKTEWLNDERKDWLLIAQKLADRNVLIVHAAGNNSDISKGRRINAKWSGGLAALSESFSNILLVGSLGNPGFTYANADNRQLSKWNTDSLQKYMLSGFSAIGDEIDVAAPGASIGTIGLSGQSIIENGTSAAAPLVSGVASLIWLINPKLAPYDVKHIIVESGKSAVFTRQIWDLNHNGYSFPVLDAPEAIREAFNTISIHLPPSCPNQCSGHGTCTSNGQCVCNLGYGGPDCQQGNCGTIPQLTWTPKPSPPSLPSYANASVVYQNKLHIFRSDQHLSYDPVTNAWSTLALIPYPQGDGAALSVNGKIYAMSDGSTVPLGTRHTMLWNESNDTWSELDQRLGAQRYPAYAYLNGEIIVAGSYSANGDDGAVNAYNPVTNTWRILAAIPNPPGMSTLTFGSYSGSLIIFGGLPGKNLLQVYDPALNRWTVRPAAPFNRDVARGMMYGQQLWIAGGVAPPAGLQDTIWVYDVANDKWCPGPTLPTKSAQSPILEQINGKIYFIGSYPADMWQGSIQ